MIGQTRNEIPCPVADRSFCRFTGFESKMHSLLAWVLVRRKAVIRSLACILYIATREVWELVTNKRLFYVVELPAPYNIETQVGR